jgi:hypothetical protein
MRRKLELVRLWLWNVCTASKIANFWCIFGYCLRDGYANMLLMLSIRDTNARKGYKSQGFCKWRRHSLRLQFRRPSALIVCNR